MVRSCTTEGKEDPWVCNWEAGGSWKEQAWVSRGDTVTQPEGRLHSKAAIAGQNHSRNTSSESRTHHRIPRKTCGGQIHRMDISVFPPPSSHLPFST